MSSKFTSSFEEPDEVVELELVRSELVYLEGLSVSRTVHQPGWRWSKHVRPHVGGDWCQTRHVGLAVSGAVHVVLHTGDEFDLREGMVADVPPGHDAWVIGDILYVDITWTGARTWLPITDPGTDRVLATILFTDIVESTSLARSMGDDHWADFIATFDARVRESLAGCGGREIRTTGDGILAIFTGAGRAVSCAQALRPLAHTLGVRLRLALHAGEIDLVGRDIRGIAVHEAARILAAAHPDEILVSATVQGLLSSGDFAWRDRGWHEMKGFAESRQLFALDN
ncbi:MAG: adenylate/guanylate cyclase domain-containing protein [Acidimicrobiia bacterium]